MSQDIKPKAQMRLGNYTLTVKLAEGIFSETWLAEHVHLEGKETCLKIFTNDRFVHYLTKEKVLRVVKDLVHLPNIEDYDSTGPLPYLAQEVVAGRSLRQLLREAKKFSAATAFEYLKKIIHALKKMHDQNTAHLDLRPEHIIVNDKGDIRLLDYIIGRASSLALAEYYREFANKGTSLPKPIMRSLMYKSRLQRTGQELGIQADVFSLGILLFEMVTGIYPNKNAEIPSAAVPGIPRKVDTIYARCCGKSDDFYENCGEILEAIEGEEELSVNLTPGVRPLREDAAIVSVTTFAGGKNYVDGKNIGLISKNLDEIINSKLRFLAFDLTNIDYLNSSAIGFLVNFGDRIQSMGGTMVLCNVEKKVLTILEALGLEKVFVIFPNTQKAEEYIFTTIAKASSSNG